jgi:hypothetical protein
MVQASCIEGICFVRVFGSTQECQHSEYQRYSHISMNMQHLSASGPFDALCSTHISNNHWVDIDIHILKNREDDGNIIFVIEKGLSVSHVSSEGSNSGRRVFGVGFGRSPPDLETTGVKKLEIVPCELPVRGAAATLTHSTHTPPRRLLPLLRQRFFRAGHGPPAITTP